MRRLHLLVLLVMVAGLVTSALVAGCSGSGSSTAPPELAQLQTAANDHMTTVAFVQQWFPVLYA